jgi:hypothetical protein
MDINDWRVSISRRVSADAVHDIFDLGVNLGQSE